MNKRLPFTVIKFIITGGISTALNYLVFYLLVKFTITNYLIASITGYITGLAFGFILNNFWTFQSSTYHISKIVGYCFLYLLSLCISLLFLYISVEKFHFNKLLMNFFAISISTVCNFIGLNLFVFKNEHP